MRLHVAVPGERQKEQGKAKGAGTTVRRMLECV